MWYAFLLWKHAKGQLNANKNNSVCNKKRERGTWRQTLTLFYDYFCGV